MGSAQPSQATAVLTRLTARALVWVSTVCTSGLMVRTKLAAELEVSMMGRATTSNIESTMAMLGQMEYISKMHATSQVCIAVLSCSGSWRRVEQSAGTVVGVVEDEGVGVDGGPIGLVLGWKVAVDTLIACMRSTSQLHPAKS